VYLKMPTIPSLERRTVNTRTSIATVDARGAASLGREVAAGITEVKDTRDRYQLADAASKFSILKHQQDNAFDEDDKDYATFDERYSTSMDEGMAEIAEGISDTSLRTAFMLDSRPRIVAGQERIKDKAFAVETDVQRANVNSRFNGLREVILGDDETESIRAIQDAKDLLASSRDSGYYSAEEMGNMERAFTADAAIGYVNKQDIEDQKAALESDLVQKNVPSDIIAKKLRSLENQTQLAEAQKIADSFDGLSISEQNSKFRDYEGKQRQLVQQLVGQNNALQKQVKIVDDEALHQDWYMKVITGDEGFTLPDLLDKGNTEFLNLDDKYQKDLMRAASAASTPRSASNRKVIDHLYKLNAEGSKDKSKYIELREYYTANVDKLSAKDMDRWSKLSNEGIIPEEYASEFTLIQRVDNILATAGVKDSVVSLLVRDKVDKWNESYFETYNKAPDQTAMDDEITRQVTEVSRSRWGDSPLSDTYTAEDNWIKMTVPRQNVVIADTIENPAGATLGNVHVVLGEVLGFSRDPEMIIQGINLGIDRYEELNDDDKGLVFNSIRDNDTEKYDRIGTKYLEVNNRTPTQQDMIDGYRKIRDFKRKQQQQ
jgi:hypothetical protein